VGLPGQTTSLALLNFSSIILETGDMVKEIRELKANGIEVGEVDNPPWGKFAQLKDVDGNALTLYQK
jgi:hypothetical protein